MLFLSQGGCGRRGREREIVTHPECDTNASGAAMGHTVVCVLDRRDAHRAGNEAAAESVIVHTREERP